MPVAIRSSTRRRPLPESSPASWGQRSLTIRTCCKSWRVSTACVAWTRGRLRAHPNLYGLFLLGPQGNLVISTGLDPTEFQSQSAFRDAVDRSLKLGEPGVSNALTAPDARVIALTMPVRAKDQAEEEPIGVIGSLLSVERLGASVTPVASGDTLIAVIADGMVIAAQGVDPAVNALAATTVPALSASGR